MQTLTTISVNLQAYSAVICHDASERAKEVFHATYRTALSELAHHAEDNALRLAVDEERSGSVPFRILECAADPGGSGRALDFMERHIATMRESLLSETTESRSMSVTQ